MASRSPGIPDVPTTLQSPGGDREPTQGRAVAEVTEGPGLQLVGLCLCDFSFLSLRDTKCQPRSTTMPTSQMRRTVFEGNDLLTATQLGAGGDKT